MKDVLYAPRASRQPWHLEGEDGKVKTYPTEKPLSIVQRLLENSTAPGEVAIDPFAGSGVLGEAAVRSSRQAVLGDTSAFSMATITSRLAYITSSSSSQTQA